MDRHGDRVQQERKWVTAGTLGGDYSRRPYTGHVPRPQEAFLIASRFITALPGAWSRGNRCALNQLLPLFYEGRP
jgi:hypothetical protein